MSNRVYTPFEMTLGMGTTQTTSVPSATLRMTDAHVVQSSRPAKKAGTNPTKPKPPAAGALAKPKPKKKVSLTSVFSNGAAGAKAKREELAYRENVSDGLQTATND